MKIPAVDAKELIIKQVGLEY